MCGCPLCPVGVELVRPSRYHGIEGRTPPELATSMCPLCLELCTLEHTIVSQGKQRFGDRGGSKRAYYDGLYAAKRRGPQALEDCNSRGWVGGTQQSVESYCLSSTKAVSRSTVSPCPHVVQLMVWHVTCLLPAASRNPGVYRLGSVRLGGGPEGIHVGARHPAEHQAEPGTRRSSREARVSGWCKRIDALVRSSGTSVLRCSAMDFNCWGGGPWVLAVFRQCITIGGVIRICPPPQVSQSAWSLSACLGSLALSVNSWRAFRCTCSV